MAKKTDNAEDLLDSIPDEAGEPWIAEEPGDSCAGIVIDLYEVPDEYDPEEKVPVVVVRTNEGELFNVAGYRSGLRHEIRRREPMEIGGIFAVKYIGETIVKKGRFKGKPFYAYKTAYKPPATAEIVVVAEKK